MGHMGHGSWVKYSVGHMGHGSLEVIHRLLWSRSKQMRFQRPAKLSKRQVELAKRKLFHKRGPATANTRSRRRVQVRWITHVTASDDRRQQWRVGSHPSNTVQQDHAVPWKQARPTYKLNSLADWKLMELPEIWSDSHVLETGNRTEPNSNTMLSEFPARNAWEADVSQV